MRCLGARKTRRRRGEREASSVQRDHGAGRSGTGVMSATHAYASRPMWENTHLNLTRPRASYLFTTTPTGSSFQNHLQIFFSPFALLHTWCIFMSENSPKNIHRPNGQALRTLASAISCSNVNSWSFQMEVPVRLWAR
jgi:hypothetical protein